MRQTKNGWRKRWREQIKKERGKRGVRKPCATTTMSNNSIVYKAKTSSCDNSASISYSDDDRAKGSLLPSETT